jgi:hypothetical protein
MNRWIARTATVMGLVTLMTGAAVAGQKDKGKDKKPAQAKCPVCGMFLAKKPTKASTVAVKLDPKGPTMYCCSKCKMPDSVLVKGGHKGHMGGKGHKGDKKG